MESFDLYPAIGVATSVISLFFALLAYRLSLRTQAKAEEHQRLISLKVFFDTTQKYSTILHEVTDELAPLISELRAVAAKAHDDMAYIFNEFDNTHSSKTELRHVFIHATRKVREEFDFTIANYNGQYLANSLRFLKDTENRFKHYQDRNFKVGLFSMLRRGKAHRAPEDRIMASKSFRDDLKQLYQRIPKDCEAELLTQTYRHIQRFTDTLAIHEEQLKRLQHRLEKGLMENDRESSIKIAEIPDLGYNYLLRKWDIERIRHLNLCDVPNAEKYAIPTGIAYSVYAGSVLQIIATYDTWGYKHPDWDTKERRLEPLIF